MSTAELFIEIRCEELPARFARPAEVAVGKAVQGLLKGIDDRGIDPETGADRTFSTRIFQADLILAFGQITILQEYDVNGIHLQRNHIDVGLDGTGRICVQRDMCFETKNGRVRRGDGFQDTGGVALQSFDVGVHRDQQLPKRRIRLFQVRHQKALISYGTTVSILTSHVGCGIQRKL